MPNLEWDEIKGTAKSIFDIWVGSPELNWAHEAWKAIGAQGLTKYDNEVDKQVVIIRFFVLGTLYHEYCHFAFDEYCHIEYTDWIDALSDELFISSLRLGQLVGSNYRNNEEITDKNDEEQLVIETVSSLVEQQRDIVVSALIKGFGNQARLFASLWLSQNTSQTDNDHNDGGDETIDSVFNSSATPEKLRAFEWFVSGMPSIQEYRDYSHLMSKCEKVKELIATGESSQIEFRVNLCYNPHEKKKDNSMIENVTKTVAAFINSGGGKLLIGVSNEGTIVGVNNDYHVADPQKQNRDGFELFLANTLKDKIDFGLIHLICQIDFCEIDGKDVCEVTVSPSPITEVAYLDKKVFVRQLNRTIELTGKDLVAFILSRQIKAG